MFFDNIFGTSDNNNNERSNNGDENNNNGYSLKNISLRQGRAFLKDEKKLNRMNTYLAQNTGNNKITGVNVEGFDGSQQPQAATASASASSAPEAVVSPKDSAEATLLDKLDDAFDSKMAAYSSALSEYNKELLNNQNYFVVQVKTLTPINSCFNCDPSFSGNDCAAMGVSNSNGDIRTALPNSTSPTANLLPCVVAGVTVPGWSVNPADSGSCIAPLGQKCCNLTIVNGQPVCAAGFGADNYDENAMNGWISACIAPPSPEEINQKIALANEYCQGNGISLNYWSTNANNFVLVTIQDPGNVRPFAKMNSIPVWIINTFPNLQDANQAKNALVFSPTVKNTLTSTREDMLNAGTALIKAASSQHSTTLADRKAMEQKINVIKTKISKIDSHQQMLDKNMDAGGKSSVVIVNEPFTPSSSASTFVLPNSLLGQEEDTRIQFQSSYAYYTVWVVIAIFLIVVMFSNIFMGKKEDSENNDGEGSSSSMSSMTLIIGTLMMIVFIYFIIQYILAYFKVSRPDLPFGQVNPLL